MVGSVTASTSYYSYLNQILGVQSTSPTTTSSTPAPSSSSTNNTTASNASSAVSSLLSGNSFKPEILSLLQGNNSSGVFDPVDSLLNGGTSSNNNALTSLLTNLYSTSASAAVTKARNNASPTTSGTPTPVAGAALIDSLISALSHASVAYNSTMQQNVQNMINSYNPGGIQPVTA